MWALFIELTVNDPAGVELARFESAKDCQKAAMAIWAIGATAAEENRGKGEPSDVYGICRKIAEPPQLP
ncbi:hypothetical protein [Stutzerimonas stutzeri]|uniref:hypothetical protein n=1 Tax=Stutzerimonas stutzeri TaxID=316 RepID=UPI0021087B5F|nr:hypothetical protein [Stutzerimonas stutzeri]MCQ4242239.1 hypothetical protein [Stutzerimonas stutzeri]